MVIEGQLDCTSLSEFAVHAREVTVAPQLGRDAAGLPSTRPARLEDAAELHRIYEQVSWMRQDSPELWVERLEQEPAWVAEIDGRVCGFIMARVDFGEFGSLEPAAVVDTIGVDASSGHKGVGSALISQLMTNLVGLRVERVRTEVDWNHFGLLSFLDRMGFRPHRRLALRRAVGA